MAPGMKIGKNNPKIGNQGYFHSRNYFGTFLVSYFGPKARNLFSSKPFGSQNQGVVFSGLSFRKGVRVPLSQGEGFGLGFRGVVGGGLLVEKVRERGNGGGEGGGWGRDRQVNAQALSKLPFIGTG